MNTPIATTPVGGSLTRLVRQSECPKCGTKVEDIGEKDELGCTWFIECRCGWWRELYMPNDKLSHGPANNQDYE